MEVEQEGEGVQLLQGLYKVPLGATREADSPVKNGSEDDPCDTSMSTSDICMGIVR